MDGTWTRVLFFHMIWPEPPSATDEVTHSVVASPISQLVFPVSRSGQQNLIARDDDESVRPSRNRFGPLAIHRRSRVLGMIPFRISEPIAVWSPPPRPVIGQLNRETEQRKYRQKKKGEQQSIHIWLSNRSHSPEYGEKTSVPAPAIRMTPLYAKLIRPVVVRRTRLPPGLPAPSSNPSIRR